MKQGKQYTSKQTIINRQQKQQNQWKYFENGSEQIRCAYSNAYWWYVTILAIICKSWFCGMKKACRLYTALAPLCYNSLTESFPVYLPEFLSTIHPDNFAPFLTQKPSAYLSQQQQQQKRAFDNELFLSRARHSGTHYSMVFVTQHQQLLSGRGAISRCTFSCLQYMYLYYICVLRSDFGHVWLLTTLVYILKLLYINYCVVWRSYVLKPFYFVHCMCLYFFLLLFVRRIVP